MSKLGEYTCYIRKNGINFDKCLEDELTNLWDRGIETVGCCCGFHEDCKTGYGYIQVKNKYIPEMLALGYELDKNCEFGNAFKCKLNKCRESEGFDND